MPLLGTSKTYFSDFIHFCSIILSHPLYFSHFIFFTPYLLKIVSFLSTPFITTLLLFLALLTGLVHESFSNVLAQTKVSHHLTACCSVLERLQPQKDDGAEELHGLEDLEQYRIVFGSSVMEVEGNQVKVLEEKSEDNPLQASENEDHSISKCGAFTGNEVEGNSVTASKLENSACADMDEKRLENFLKLLDQFERLASNVEEKKIEPPLGSKVDKIVEKHKVMKHGSEVTIWNKVNVTTPGSVKNNHGGKEYNNGSMRKGKEWKRTLACKLFEERHSTEGGEGMDLLWETYEDNSTKTKPKNDKKKKKQKKEDEADGEDGHKQEEEVAGHLCCLQALKLSAGKMNLGIRRPNLVRISKAIRGIGLLQHVKKHSKKVHNNGDGHLYATC